MNIILYGPPGVGKTTVGKALAAHLKREFVDADPLIEARVGLPIPQIFSQHGETEFRKIESDVCAELGANDNLVIAPGGGALLNPANRTALERHGLIVCLRAEAATLLARMPNTNRPLLADDPAAKLQALLNARGALYDSFPVQLDTTQKSIEQIVAEIEALLVSRRLPVNAPGMQHEIVLGYGLLDTLPQLLDERGFAGNRLIVTDEKIAKALPFFGGLDAASPTVCGMPVVVLPSGEEYKTLDTIRKFYDAFLTHSLDRNSLVIAVGGGVIGDMTGFAAATYMRGVRWVNVPTTLLAMVDASLGGKTGVDLPQGKNLVGAFYPPALIVSDPLTLNTLPHRERIGGMAEVIKHGLIDDVDLFESIERGQAFGHVDQIRQAIAVKVRVVEEDPLERGRRATLNVGHTIGHAIESASGFKLGHGESVAIGMVAEAKLAERLGLSDSTVTRRVEEICSKVGLPIRSPGLDADQVRQLMSSDKKKAGKTLKFAFAKRVGEAVWGVEADETTLREVIIETVKA